VTYLLEEAFKNLRESGHKKSGLNKGSAGITFVPGLFSELFNVAASRPAQMTTERLKSSPKRAHRQGKPPVNQSRASSARPKTLNVFFAFSVRST
jgi:hypothetical protein